MIKGIICQNLLKGDKLQTNKKYTSIQVYNESKENFCIKFKKFILQDFPLLYSKMVS